MTSTSAILLVVGTAVAVGAGVYFMEKTRSTLPTSNVTGTGNASKAGGGAAPGGWADQLAVLIGAGASAYDKVSN